MELFVTPKGSKFIVQDRKERTLYTVKKKGFGSKFVLLDASGYDLYTLVQTAEGKKPEFNIILNDKVFMTLKCLSVFLDPTIECEGSDMKFVLKSKDRKSFQIVKDEHEVGTLAVIQLMSGDLQYEIHIENVDFDDYIPLFAVAVEKTFGDFNRNK